MTFTKKNSAFTSVRGNPVEVFCEKEVGHNGTFSAFGRTVRTFARVCGQEFDCRPGCSFEAPSVVHENGF